MYLDLTLAPHCVCLHCTAIGAVQVVHEALVVSARDAGEQSHTRSVCVTSTM
jgi:hypothetical protein